MKVPEWYLKLCKSNVTKLSEDEGYKICTTKFIEWMGRSIKEKSILDVGCGNGWSLDKFKEIGFSDILGISVNTDELEFAKKQEHKVLYCEMHCLDLFGRKFDVIYMRHVLEHALAPYEVIRQSYNILNKGGRILICLPSYSWDSMPKHISPMNLSQCIEMLRKNKFKVDRWEYEWISDYNPHCKEADFEIWIEGVK